MTVSLEAIAEASRLIDPVFLHTPQFESEPLSEALGMRLTVKVECCNPIRSFKGRGADVRLTGDDFDAAKGAAKAHAEREGLTFVEDGALAPIAEGAGTIAVELTRNPQPYDAVLVPVGNGALVNGIGTWLEAHAPRTRVIGVCAEGAPAMARSWRAGEAVTTSRADTIADGIAVRVPVADALDDMRHAADEMVTVPDELMLTAMRLCFEHLGLVVEPPPGLAACLRLRERLAGARVATPLCGGNVTPEQATRWLR